MKNIEHIEFIYSLLGTDEHKKGVEMFYELSEAEQNELFEYANQVDGDFSNASDWQNGTPPTFEESKENVLFLLNEH